MKIKKLAICTLTAATLIGAVGVASLYSREGKGNPIIDLDGAASGNIWSAVSCRARMYLRSAEGEVPGVSWIELWELMLPKRGFECTEGEGFATSVRFSVHASDEDLKAGAHIFRERCTRCHGSDGSGGAVGPSLTGSEYNHGDSDLAIYKVLRDGIPGTPMPSAGLTLLERLQVAAYLTTLRAHLPGDREPEPSRLAIHVSNERLLAAGTKPDEWLMYSGSYNGWRHMLLAEMTPANVAQLKMRWVNQFDISDPNIEATPLVIDGTIFLVVDPAHVLALNAKTGALIWEYRRPIPAGLPIEFGVNRGLAVQGSTLFFGSLDGYLVAINANDGKVMWQTSVASPAEGYTMSGAPLVINHSVVVGVAGGEFGIRGFLAAYDLSTGRQEWKFNTIPGPGEVGHETWENDAWKSGGGATWNTGSYDPSTDLLYWGVGNPSPGFSGDVRPGDNLFTASVIALHAKTGTLAWYFQFTPHDEQDRDAAQTPVLADLLIKGVVRKAICWPNRNGFITSSTVSQASSWSGRHSSKLTGRKGLHRPGGQFCLASLGCRRRGVVYGPASPALQTGKTLPLMKNGDPSLFRQPRAVPSLRSSLLTKSCAERMDFLWGAVPAKKRRTPAKSLRSMLLPAREDGNTAHRAAIPTVLTAVCSQRMEDWCSGPRTGSFSPWMPTLDAKSGALRLGGRPIRPRSLSLSTDDRWFSWLLDERCSSLGCKPWLAGTCAAVSAEPRPLTRPGSALLTALNVGRGNRPVVRGSRQSVHRRRTKTVPAKWAPSRQSAFNPRPSIFPLGLRIRFWRGGRGGSR